MTIKLMDLKPGMTLILSETDRREVFDIDASDGFAVFFTDGSYLTRHGMNPADMVFVC